MLTQADFENKALQIADDIFPFDEPPSHGNITALAAQLYQILTAHNAGAPTHKVIDDGEVTGYVVPSVAAYSAGAQALDPRDVLADTGHPEADRLIGRLTSADPDFDDCTDAAVLIRQLVAEHRGPDGYATWKDAAVAERQKRVAAERPAGAQEPMAIPDGWVLVKRERIEEIRQHARTEFVNSYLGRNLYDERSLMQNERIGEEALDNIRGVLSWIEEDEKDRIAAQPRPQTDATRDEEATFEMWFNEETKAARYNGQSVSEWPAKAAWMARAEIERIEQEGEA